MRRSTIGAHLQSGIGAALFAGALVACNALIGTKDVFLDADGSIGDEAGEPEGGASSSSSSSGSSGNEGGSKEAGGDANCTADLQNDKANCGACGHDCLGGTCAAGKCLPVALVSVGAPRYVAVDATNIYYTDGSLDAVKKIPKAGGSPADVCTIVGTGANSLRIDATNAYFTVNDGGAGFNGDGAVEKCPLAGGAASTITGPQKSPYSLVLDGSTLYWVQQVDPPVVMKMALSGSAAPYFTGAAGGDLTLELGTGFLYAADNQGGGKLVRCTLGAACATPETLTTDANGIGDVVEGTARLLWGNGVYPGTIWQSQPDGGGATKLVTGPPIPHSYVFDAQYLYWLNAGQPQNVDEYFSGSIMRCPHTGGVVDCGATGPETLGASNYHFIRGLVSDTNAIYWVEGTTIWRLAK